MTIGAESSEELRQITEAFCPDAAVGSVVPYGNGHIHSTYLAQLKLGEQVILQRINTTVFRNPGAIVRNLARVTRHLGDSAMARRPLIW